MELRFVNTKSISQTSESRTRLLGWSQEALAEAADVSIPTIKRLEADEGPLGGRSETTKRFRPRSSAAASYSSTKTAAAWASAFARAGRIENRTEYAWGCPQRWRYQCGRV